MAKKTIFKAISLPIKNIIWLYKPYLKYGKLFVALSLFFWCIIIPIAQLVSVYLPSTIINKLEAGVPFSEIVIFVISIQIILMFQPMYENVFNRLCKDKTLANIDVELKKEAYHKAIETDLKYIDDPEYYDNYSWAVSQYASKADEAQDLFNRISSSVITIISMLTIIAILSPIAVLVTLVGTLIENLMFIITNHFDVKKDDEIVKFDRRLGYYHRVFYESRYAADLKSTSIKYNLFDGIEEARKNKIGVIKKYARKIIPWSLAGNFTFYVASTFVILNIAYGIFSGSIETVGAYITMMVSVETLKGAINEMFYYVKDANRLSLYAEKIKAFFDVKSSIEADNNNKIKAPDAVFHVKFDNICFRYNNSNFCLKNLNLEIYPGEKVAIVGENGVGKSTLVKLLMRFYDVNSGTISINGIDLKKYDLDSLRKRIGVAFQQTNIYALSLIDNINVYGTEWNNNIQNAIIKTGLDKVIIKNDANLETELTREFDDSGIMLSGGEVQKIGIARLLSKEFGLLIFDEPSSALDPLAEYEMSKLILDSSNNATTIVIAHRLSTIRNVDRIILIDDGQVKEAGSHEELMSYKGKYYEMFTKQAENYQFFDVTADRNFTLH